MNKLTQVLRDEAFYTFRTGGHVWVSETKPEGHAVKFVPFQPITPGQKPGVRWFLELSTVHLKGLNGPLSYWVSENER